MKIKKLIVLFSLLLAVVALTVSATFAWYSFSEQTPSFIIQTGTIKVDAKAFYTLDDPNETTASWDELRTAHTFSNCIPGEVYTFRIDIKNAGTLNGDLYISLNNIVLSGRAVEDIQKSLNLHYQEYGTDGISPTFTEVGFTDLHENQETSSYSYVLINKYPLDSASDISYYFRIEIIGSSTGNTSLTGYTVTIGNMLVKLDQQRS